MNIFSNKGSSECEAAYKAFINSGGNAIVSGASIYIGGHPKIKGERKGELVVNNAGVFFKDKKNSNYFYLPTAKLLRVSFETGEAVSRNAVFSRLLAISGFIFAYKKKTREKHMFLTIDYVENGVENVLLIETQLANEFASEIAKVRQEANAKKETGPEPAKTVSELMIEINELRALGILTPEEFIEKKRELLSRI